MVAWVHLHQPGVVRPGNPSLWLLYTIEACRAWVRRMERKCNYRLLQWNRSWSCISCVWREFRLSIHLEPSSSFLVNVVSLLEQDQSGFIAHAWRWSSCLGVMHMTNGFRFNTSCRSNQLVKGLCSYCRPSHCSFWHWSCSQVQLISLGNSM